MPEQSAGVRLRAAAQWLLLVTAMAAPLIAAGQSPLLQWRDPVYIAAGFAGIAAFSLMLMQPLIARHWLAGLSPHASRRLHPLIGAVILALVLAHVAGLWITSPPDVVDALLLRSPTPFSVWGVAAMWALIATAIVAVMRARKAVRWRPWQRAHKGLTLIVIAGTVLHALLIEGTMETVTKWGLAGLVVGASVLSWWPDRIKQTA